MENEEKLREYLKWVTADLVQSRERVAELESQAAEPIAISGIACRFPAGVRSPEDLWRLVSTGTDAAARIPTDRGWDVEDLYDPELTRPGSIGTREGSFLEDLGDFDAGFFGISPREALGMDPQQRLLLETSWEALERAGIDPHSLRNSRTGVFVGSNTWDYAPPLTQAPDEVAGYLMTGNTPSVMSGRISYTLGLEGPAVTLDTACSSSLVALHLAARSLRSGDCSLALVGGVAVMAAPGVLMEFSRQRGLAPDGRSKAFAAGADGVGWGEGVGVLVVERLSDARRHGRRVLAVVRGSAVNQDGASNGLTAPNGPSQQRVIRQALASAGLSAADVDAVEAHGTGTRLGDPIEAQALLATYGQGRSAEKPLWLGSLKSNIGHTQAAAGVAGVIKMVMALQHRTLPQTLHVDEPTPQVDWTAGAVELLTEARAWEEVEGRPRRAGVSSFGISGTNAHVIVEEAPALPSSSGEGPVVVPVAVPWVVSGRSVEGLRAQAGRLLARVEGDLGLSVVDVGASLVGTRSVFEHRAVVVGGGREELLGGLAGLAAGEPSASVIADEGASGPAGGVGVLFTGQGAQRVGMGRGLYEAFPVFADVLDEVCGAFDELSGGSLREVMFEGPAGVLDRTEWAQPALFAVEVALFALAESWGVRPELVAGHSIGELAAAYVAGVWSLSDAVRVVAARGRLMGALPSGGAMVALQASEGEVLGLLDGSVGVGIAAVNGPEAVVVSGVEAAVVAVSESVAGWGRKTKRLVVSHAFHSLLMDPMLDDFRAVLDTVEFNEPTLPVISALTGRLATAGELCDPEFWVRHVREPVRFADVADVMRAEGVTAFTELGPDGVLSALVPGCVPMLRSGRDEPRTAVSALASLFVQGQSVDWSALFTDTGARTVELPTYAFQRTRYWLEATSGGASTGHPFVGAVVELVGAGGLVVSGRLSRRSHGWLADHAVLDTVLVPGTAFVELASWIGERWGGGVEELTLQAPLVLPDRDDVQIQVVVGAPDDSGRREISVYSRADAGTDDESAGWVQHATGTLAADRQDPAEDLDWTVWPPAGAVPVETEGAYERLAGAGFAYGPAFQGLRMVWKNGDDVFAEVELPVEQHSAAASFALHPALLDSALHAIGAGELLGDDPTGRLPFSWRGATVHAWGATALRVRLTRTGPDTLSLVAADPAGQPVVSIDALALRPITADQFRTAGTGVHDALYRVDWTERDLPESAEAASYALLGAGDALTRTAARTGIPAYADLDRLREAVDADTPVPPCVVVPLASSTTPAGFAVAEAHHSVHDALAVVQEWLADERFAAARLMVLTRRAVAVGRDEDVLDLERAPVRGLVRSALRENPDRFLLADVDELTPDAIRVAVAASSAGEAETAIRGGRVLVPRLARAVADVNLPLPGASAWRLESLGRGTLEDNLVLTPYPAAEAPLKEGEVRVGVRAGGLNFRDVMIALGMYPGEARIGAEGAGVVLGVGPGVTRLAPGDRVMGLFYGTIGPTVVTDHRVLARIPDDWSYTDAAAVPVVFLTAYYGLVDLAGLRPGERVLIHSAAGGVGMAAAQLAGHLGAEVFGTASPHKWDTVRSLGVAENRIASSRSLEFADRFAAEAGERGMDVVLNSLAGEYVDASLHLLGDGGRFLEMGKTDKRHPEEVAAAHPGVHYLAFDMLEAGPDRIGQMLAEIVTLFGAGALRPLPVRSWDVRQAVAAFRHISQAKHIGKVVLTLPPAVADGTVLLTGATGSLGGLIARHLVREHGVRRLVLVSRSGPQAPGAAELAREMADMGAQAELVACDLADRDEVRRLIDTITADGPLTGVVQAAGVLDDGVVDALTPERVDAVLRPKLDAAWHLHELTLHQPLSVFALFSSAAATFGAAGQGSYAAANTFLDALAQHRRAQGLPAVSMAWGLWAQADGMTAELSHADRQRMSRGGLVPLSEAEGLALFDASLDHGDAALVPARLDLAALRRSEGPVPEVLRSLVRAPARRAGAARSGAKGAEALRRKLLALPADERLDQVLATVRAQASAVLGHGAAAAVQPDRAFKEMGFDSLTAVELRNRLNTETGARLPATLVFDHPTPQALAARILADVLGSDAEQEPQRAAAEPVHGSADLGEPLAVVGMACRFPGGAESPERLWQLVASGADAISGFPADRGWDTEALYDPDPDQPGTTYAREGGFLNDAAGFDAGFFGISPREAISMDPQQRLLLEAAWEALEDAGIDPEGMRGTGAGVFVGASGQTYSSVLARAAQDYEGYLLTGSTGSVLSGRLAYSFGLEGPAVTVDTACSSSLVALHLAGQALRSGECSMALVGGVAVLSTPDLFVEFSRQRGLSPDGRCKAFGAGADGTAWAEGVGMLVVERLSDAQRNGHQVLAVVRGSAVNQDGASNGLTAPNGPSQQRVIRQALANAGLSAAEVDVVEAHGTGTRLGDPIEAQALMATYGQERSDDQPLWLGSLKSNIGHTQAAAGVAGVIKTVLALRHGVLPKTLHADEVTAEVDWSSGAVQVLTQTRAWPETGAPRRAAVSAFGVSGTNAHVIIEQAPDPEPVAPAEPVTAPSAVVPWTLSARSEPALRAQAARLLNRVQEGDATPADLGLSLLSSRAVLDHRAVVVGAGTEALMAGLEALAAGVSAVGTVQGSLQGSSGRVVFVFPGQGGQWVGMAAGLLGSSPVFAARLVECAEVLDALTGWSLLDVVRGVEGAPLLERVDVVQPVLFAVMVSLSALWASVGVVPAAVVGHSQGEIAAACVAGALSLEDAARVVVLRSRAILVLSGLGGMASVALPAVEVGELLGRWGSALSVAVVNGPSSTVVSGDGQALDELLADLADRGVRAKRLPVDYASHSVHVEAIEDELLDLLAPITPLSSDVAFYSAVTGGVVDTTTLDAAYWYRNLRQTVRFEDATRALLADGHTVFVEASPHPVLTLGIQETCEDTGTHAVSTGTLRRDEGGLDRFLLSAAQLHVHGVPVDWKPLFTGTGARTVALPTYPFQHQHYWPEAAPAEIAQGGVDPAESEFWQAVEDGDLGALADTLKVPGDGALSTVLPALSSWRQQRRTHSAVDGWRYRETWRALPGNRASKATGRWLVVVPADAGGDAWAAAVPEALSVAGAQIRTLALPEHGADRTDLARRVRDAAAGEPLDGILSLAALDTRDHPDLRATPVGAAITMALVQALGDIGETAPLWCLTRGAVSVGSGDRSTGAAQALTWGLGRVAALEHAGRWGGLVDLPPAPTPRAVGLLLGLLTRTSVPQDGAEDQLAVRDSGVFARRLVRSPRGGRPPASWTPKGTVLITGGTGALGARMARWAAAGGADHVVLASRSGEEAPGATELAADIAATGCRVTVTACDLTDRESVAALVDGLAAQGDPVRTVLHTAGVSAYGAFAELPPADFADVLAAKVLGARHLDELLGDSLDGFVLFSSIAGVWGSGGQAHYSAANAYLDALARRRHAAGRRATSVAWGSWGDGMLSDERARQLRRGGVLAMDPDLAVTALEQALADEETAIVVADVAWDRFFPAFTLHRPSPLLSDLPEVVALRAGDGTAPATADDGSWRQTLTGLSPDARPKAVLELVRTQVAAVLGYASPEAVDAERAFREIGFDSLTAVELRNRLKAVTGLALPATVVFDHPSPSTLSAHLLGEVGGAPTDAGGLQDALAGIDRLESLVATAVEDGDRARIAARLQFLLARVGATEADGVGGAEGGGLGGAEPVVTDGEDSAEQLRSASDDEIFAFINRELGKDQ